MYRGLLGTPETIDPGRRRAGYLGSTGLFIPAYAPIGSDGNEFTVGNPLNAAATQLIDTAGFSAVGASVLDVFFNTPIVGTGVTYNQGAGSLNIVAGTSTNAEFLARSVRSYTGSMRLRSSHILSQRIINNNFTLLLGDLLGEGLAYTINSATSVTVTAPGLNFNSTMVGQFVMLGGITGAAGVPGRYAIASVSGNDITFTVAGWPASGTGTLTLFGRNYLRHLFTSTVATNVNWDVQRNGWAAGDTVATINTTASPGVVLMSELTGRDAWLSDQLRASSAVPDFTSRASRYENIPDPNVPLFVFLWSFNGSTAPASSTTWTMGHVSVEMFPNQSVYLQGIRAQGNVNALSVKFNATPGVNATLVASTANVGNVALQLPSGVTDVASAAITSTATTAAFTPTFGTAYQIVIPVTAVTGTTPTMDVVVQESPDGGTNWFDVYHFPRITATGVYQSPPLVLTGTRVRYAQTLTGTTPSFTRAVFRNQSSLQANTLRQIFDRAISLTTLNATTASLLTLSVGNQAKLVFNVGAITTTAPALQLEGSDDGGVTWVAIGSPLTAVASSTVSLNVNAADWQLLRARVSTAGAGVTAGYVLIKAHD